MSTIQKRTFSLPREQSGYIDRLVASGTYASSSEVIRAGLRALQERDAAVERWLRDEVAPVVLAMRENPGRGVPAERAFDAIRDLHAQRLKAASSEQT